MLTEAGATPITHAGLNPHLVASQGRGAAGGEVPVTPTPRFMVPNSLVSSIIYDGLLRQQAGPALAKRLVDHVIAGPHEGKLATGVPRRNG